MCWSGRAGCWGGPHGARPCPGRVLRGPQALSVENAGQLVLRTDVHMCVPVSVSLCLSLCVRACACVCIRVGACVYLSV